MSKIIQKKSEIRLSKIEKRQQEAFNERLEAEEIVRQNSAKLKALRLQRDAEKLRG